MNALTERMEVYKKDEIDTNPSMSRVLSIFLTLAILAVSASAMAQAPKGFHTGPYLAFQIGALQASKDRDQTTGGKVGNDVEVAYGFLFGWNIRDSFSTELQGRYATDKNKGQRLHIASANAFAKYTLVAKVLTDFKSLRILPFVKGGMAVRFSVLPGAAGSTDTKVTRISYGPSVGAGVAFLLAKYFYFGIDTQEDFLFADDLRQTVNGAPNILVYKGGFQPAFAVMAILGVHY